MLLTCLVGQALAETVAFLAHAPNRLLSGAAIQLTPSPALIALFALQLGCALTRPRRFIHALALAAALLSGLLLLAAAGHAATELARHASPAARTSLAAGFWIMQFAVILAALDALRRLRANPAQRLLTAVGTLAATLALGLSHRLDDLSLAREYVTHHAAFSTAIARHLTLVAGTLVGTAALGLPLGLLAQRRPRLRAPLFGILNVVQTIPSVALFGLLMAPLAAAGLSGIGTVPALIALVAYALLPTVRGLVAGLDGVDPAAIEAATGMGFSPGQILRQVELPLAAPALLAALRIVIVQSIGLAVVAALIGAGGLGDFVFQGLGQYAVDLVLLGALPAIFLALAANFTLQLLTQHYRRQPA